MEEFREIFRTFPQPLRKLCQTNYCPLLLPLATVESVVVDSNLQIQSAIVLFLASAPSVDITLVDRTQPRYTAATTAYPFLTLPLHK